MNTPNITIKVDITNPGQFFACCGLFELANRLWPNTISWFNADNDTFFLSHSQIDETLFINKLSQMSFSSTLPQEEIERLRCLQVTRKATRTTDEQNEIEKLKKNRDTEGISISSPFNICIDWWNDKLSGGNQFKTWAGQQRVSEIVRNLQRNNRIEGSLINLFSQGCEDSILPFYFDSTTGSCASAIDVGFSLDAIDVRSKVKPSLELLSFIGLQRFRPASKEMKTFAYSTWDTPLPVALAAVICNGAISSHKRTFVYKLLYRTDYLKSFLPATPITQGVSS